MNALLQTPAPDRPAAAVSSAGPTAAQLGALLRHLSHLLLSAKRASDNGTAINSEFDTRFATLAEAVRVGRKDCDRGSSDADIAKADVLAHLSGMVETITGGLTDVSAALDEKAGAVTSVLDGLDRVGRNLRILAVNARIEAARLGDDGAGFAVVANEVQALADTMVAKATEARSLIDLEAIQNDMRHMVVKLDDTTETARSDIGTVLDSVAVLFSHLADVFATIETNVELSLELKTNLQTTMDRSKGRIEWTRERVRGAAGAIAPDQPDGRGRIDALLSQDKVVWRDSFDRLASIRASRRLRVAVDPKFVGLSFRPDGRDALQGLDVEYAQALARSLGVACEFVEAPWDTLTDLLHIGRTPGEAQVDIVVCAMPPNAAYEGVAYSETYTWLDWVLARRVGDERIAGLADLEGKTLGIINDPAAFDLLEAAGVRWADNETKPGGQIRLASLVAYNDQSRIHDCLADGVVDAFGVDLPIYHWASTNRESQWHGRIEIVMRNLVPDPFYYAMVVAAEPSSYHLLQEANRFIAAFLPTPDRQRIEARWQGMPKQGRISFRDEPGALIGEEALRSVWVAAQRRSNRDGSMPV